MIEPSEPSARPDIGSAIETLQHWRSQLPRRSIPDKPILHCIASTSCKSPSCLILRAYAWYIARITKSYQLQLASEGITPCTRLPENHLLSRVYWPLRCWNSISFTVSSLDWENLWDWQQDLQVSHQGCLNSTSRARLSPSWGLSTIQACQMVAGPVSSAGPREHAHGKSRVLAITFKSFVAAVLRNLCPALRNFNWLYVIGQFGALTWVQAALGFFGHGCNTGFGLKDFAARNRAVVCCQVYGRSRHRLLVKQVSGYWDLMKETLLGHPWVEQC